MTWADNYKLVIKMKGRMALFVSIAGCVYTFVKACSDAEIECLLALYSVPEPISERGDHIAIDLCW